MDNQKDLRPSDFTCRPFMSIAGKMEAEKVAQRIMIILSEAGNEFRLLTWKEYEQRRLEQTKYFASDKGYFERIVQYCTSAESAKEFSLEWRRVYNLASLTNR